MSIGVIGNRAFHLALLGLLLSFWLSWYLKDPIPFTTVAPIAVGGKFWENIQERRNAQ